MLKRLSDQVFQLAESPRGRDGGVYFTDIIENKLWFYKEGALKQVWDKEKISSFIFDKKGGMVFGNFDGLYKMEEDGTYRQLAGGLKINDMGVDPSGRVLFGTNYHSGATKYDLGALYVYGDDTGLRELDYGFHLSNGIGFNKDGKKMYFVDTSVRCLFEYDYDAEKATVGKKRILRRFRMDDGMPDGMTVDEEGCIWTAHWYGYCIIRTSPEGEELERHMLPVALASAVEFFDEGLFITSGTDKGRLDIAPAGFDNLTAPGLTGHIFLFETPIKGNPHDLCDIK